jgi:WD40 repeat protein
MLLDVYLRFISSFILNDVNCITLVSPNVLASGSSDKTIQLWNLTSGKNIKTLSDDVSFVDCLLLLHNTKWLASGDRDFSIKIWNIETSSFVINLQGHTGFIKSFVNLKKGHLASASSDKTVRIWNYESLEYGAALLATLKGHSNSVQSLALLPDDNLASSSLDQTVKMWNLTAIYNYPNRSNLIAAVDD